MALGEIICCVSYLSLFGLGSFGGNLRQAAKQKRKQENSKLISAREVLGTTILIVAVILLLVLALFTDYIASEF